MANRKKEVYKPKPMTEGKRNLIQGLLQEYDIQSAEDIQDALKDLLSGTIQDMLETEMDEHLGYDRYERSGEPNYRNGTKSKTVRSKYGEFEVDVPQDRQSSFEPQILPKRQKDISSIDDKIISMYAKGMTTRQISETIEDIYGFEVSEGMVSDITDLSHSLSYRHILHINDLHHCLLPFSHFPCTLYSYYFISIASMNVSHSFCASTLSTLSQ